MSERIKPLAWLSCLTAVLLVLCVSNDTFAAEVSTQLSRDGKAQMKIVVGTKASDRVHAAAQSLAQYLGRITDSTFEIVEKERADQNIIVGQPKDFPSWSDDIAFESDIIAREEILVRSASQRLLVLGASDLAVEHAVWTLLHAAGCRHYFPAAAWQIIPHMPTLSVQIDLRQRPSFLYRRLWYGGGMWDHNTKPYNIWSEYNRTSLETSRASLPLQTAHAYAGIYNANKEVFEAHPEYLALVDGKRVRRPVSQKFCVSNEGLRQLIVDSAVRALKAMPNRLSISMDPSDLTGHCECDECAKLGSVSDRVVLLANEVAAAINEKVGERYVGILAYSEHSPPPNIRVHPKVIVTATTGFIRGGFTLDEILTGWHEQGATMGIYSYYSVFNWHHSMPGAGVAASPHTVAKSLKSYHNRGVRFFSAESTDSWGPSGLGHLVASRVLWDINEADHVDDIINDFLNKSFGPAHEPMAAFYQLIDGKSRARMSDDLIGRMYRHLNEAIALVADQPAILARIDDLVLYTRYVELYRQYTAANGPARQKAFDALLLHTYGMRDSLMVDAKNVFVYPASRDRQVSLPANGRWTVHEGTNPLRVKKDWTRQELDTFVAQGIQNNQLLEFEAVAFSDTLVPASRLELDIKSFNQIKPKAAVAIDSYKGTSQGKRTWFTWVNKPGELTMSIKTGVIYKDRGPVTIELTSPQNPAMDVIDSVTLPPDGQEHEVTLRTPFTGMHTVSTFDGDGGYIYKIDPEKVSVTLERVGFGGIWDLYFYVPKDTRTIGGYTSHASGVVLGPDATVRFSFKQEMQGSGYFQIDVPKGDDGKLWKFSRVLGSRVLMTVPPYLARNADELLLPVEVVERDTQSSQATQENANELQ